MAAVCTAAWARVARRAVAPVLAPFSAARPLHSSAPAPHALRASAPVLQKKKKGGGGGGPAVVKESFDLTTQIPTALEKDAEQPVYQDDGAYPEWLWTLLEPTPTLQEAMLAGAEGLTPRERRALVKKARRALIRDKNALAAL